MHTLRCYLVLTFFAFTVAGTAHGGPITQTFFVDSALSGYTITGSASDSLGNVLPLAEQSPGSMIARFSGYLTVEYELGGALTILDSSFTSIDAGTAEPFGTPASTAYKTTGPGGTLFVAQRGLNNEFAGTTPLAADGQFSVSNLSYAWTSGDIDYVLSPFSAKSTFLLTNLFYPYPPGLTGSLDEDAAGGPRITFDIAGGGPLRGLQGHNLNLQWTGSVTAVAVPEASSMALAGIGAMCVLGWRYCQRRAMSSRG
jgi:hypothetical protein